MAVYRRVYDSSHLQLDCQEEDQLRNPTLGNRLWATLTFFIPRRTSRLCSSPAWAFVPLNAKNCVQIDFHAKLHIVQVVRKSNTLLLLQKQLTLSTSNPCVVIGPAEQGRIQKMNLKEPIQGVWGTKSPRS